MSLNGTSVHVVSLLIALPAVVFLISVQSQTKTKVCAVAQLLCFQHTQILMGQ